jgi:LPS export ABC transporter protein LptC
VTVSTYLFVRKYGGRLLLGLIAVTAVASVLWFRSLEGEVGTGQLPPSAPVIDSRAQMITRDFRHVETRMNRTAWILEAAVAEIFEKKARLQRVKITYFGRDDKPVIVTGRRARVDLGSWNAELFGDVRIVGYDGSILKTRRLVWDNRSQRLKAPWPVKIRSRHLDVTGRRMVADVGKQLVRIIGRVNSVVRPPAGSTMPAADDKEST